MLVVDYQYSIVFMQLYMGGNRIVYLIVINISIGIQPPVLVRVCLERAYIGLELIYDGINVDVIHSSPSQAQQDNLIKCFKTSNALYSDTFIGYFALP